MSENTEPVWIKCTVNAPPEALDAVSCLLMDLGAGGVEEGEGSVSAYYTPEDRGLVADGLARWGKTSGVEISWSWEEIEAEDWWESWKKYFHPFRASKRLWVRPTWEEGEPPEAGMAELVIDPGRAFGTGAHETTRLCLEVMDGLLEQEAIGSMLDVGCGSGILTVAARLLGVERVRAFDIDPLAAGSTAENAELNRVADGVKVTCCDIRQVEGTYPLVVANILYQIIMGMAPELAKRVAPGGVLLISGLLVQELPSAKGVFTDLGFELMEEREQGQWGALAFRKV